MADIKIKHLIEITDVEFVVGHLYQAMCKDMVRFEGPRKPDEACCGRCAEELVATASELKRENETYKELFFPAETQDAPES